MGETRGEKFGRNLAVIVYILNETPDISQNSNLYFKTIIKEVKKYSLRPRKEGEPPHEGCRHSMQGIDIVNSKNPREVAEFVKYCFDMTYNKKRAAVMKRAFLEELTDYLYPERLP